MLTPRKERYDQPREHIKKQRCYFVKKGLSSQGYGFSSSHVWMWKLDYEAERRRIDTFELWCWRRLLRVLWTARRSNQSILKEISLECSLEDWCWGWNSNTLAAWCEELTHWKRPWCWERLRAGREGDDRGWDGWMALPTQWTWVQVNSGSWWWTGAWHAVVQGVTKSRTRLSDWTELNWIEGNRKWNGGWWDGETELFNGCRVSVLQDEKVLEMNGGDDYTKMWRNTTEMIKMVNFLFV